MSSESSFPFLPGEEGLLKFVLLCCLALVLVSILLGLGVQALRKRKKLKRRVQSGWRRFAAYDLDPNKWWVKLLKNSKIPGLKDAIRPGIHVVKRLAWLTFTLGWLGFGVFWMVHLALQILERPTTLFHHEEKINISSVPFPTVLVGTGFNLKGDVQDELERLDEETLTESAIDWEGKAWNGDELQELNAISYHVCNPHPFELKWNGTGDELKPKVGVGQPAWVNFDITEEKINRISRFLRKFQPQCSEIMKLCSWGGQVEDCSDLFSNTYNDVGAACSFNKIPEASRVIKKHPSLNAHLYPEKEVCPDDKEKWKRLLSVDKSNKDILMAKSVNRTQECMERVNKFQKTIPLSQPSGGQQLGLSFIAEFDVAQRRCPQVDNPLAVVLDIHTIWDDSNALRRGLTLPLNHDVSITLEPIIIVSKEEIGYFGQERRKCRFFHETEGTKNPLEYYGFYSEENCIKNCIAKEVYNKTSCTLMSDPGKPPWILLGQKICATKNDLMKARKIHASTLECPICLPGCTEIRYRITEITKIPYAQDNPPAVIKAVTNSSSRNPTIRVSIAFKGNSVTMIRRELTYDWSEVLGLIGGTLGMTNGLSFMDAGRIVDSFQVTICDRTAAIIAFFAGLLAWIKCRCFRGKGKEESDTPSESSQQDQEGPAPATEESDDDDDERNFGTPPTSSSPPPDVPPRNSLWGKVRARLPLLAFLASRRETRVEEIPTPLEEDGGVTRRRRPRSAKVGALPLYHTPPLARREMPDLMRVFIVNERSAEEMDGQPDA